MPDLGNSESVQVLVGPPVSASTTVPRLTGRLNTLLILGLAVGCVALALMSAILWWRILQWNETAEPLQREVAEREQLQASVAASPADPGPRIRLGIYLALRKQTEAAAVQFTAAHALAPDNPLAAFSLGRFYMERGDSRRALPMLERAAAGAPANAEARLHLGLAYLNRDDPQSARREFEAAARLNPQLPEAHLGLSMVYSDRATAPRALREVREYIRLARDPTLGRVLLSRSFYHLQQIPDAILTARQAVQDQPNSLQAWEALGLALAEGTSAERDEATLCFQRAITLMPRFADAHVGLARAYLRQKRYADAAREFESAMALDPSGYYLYELGQAYQGAGRTREAQEQFQAASRYMEYKRKTVALRREIVRRPTDAAAYGSLARLYAANGAYDWAIPALERALRLHPGDVALEQELRRVREMAHD